MRLITIALLLLLLADAQATVLTVDCTGGEFVTIQDAVEAAVSGDTIHVAPCTYEERVVIVGKTLTVRGEGASETRLYWAGSEPAVEVLNVTSPDQVLLSDLSITRVPQTSRAIYWDRFELVLSGCEINGWVDNERDYSYQVPYGSAKISECSITRVTLTGGMPPSSVENSYIGDADFSGWLDVPWGGYAHHFTSSSSSYDRFDGDILEAALSQDSVGFLGSFGSDIIASDVTFEEIHVLSSHLEFDHCLVAGGTFVENIYTEGLYGLHLTHTTILGDLTVWDSWASGNIQGNVIQGVTFIDAHYDGEVSHNDFVGGATILHIPAGAIHDNISADPLFCDGPGEDYTLQECSPCVGAAHDGESMGAFGVGCACATATERSSWGAIKALYR